LYFGDKAHLQVLKFQGRVCRLDIYKLSKKVMVELEVKKLQSIFKTPRQIQIVDENESLLLWLIVLSVRQLLVYAIV
jgi:hypothetical protein